MIAAQAIRIHTPGDASVMRFEDVTLPPPAAGEVCIKQDVIGVNFIDVYHRTGLYPLPLPATLGMEAAGVIAAVGANVGDLKIGDRVGYASPPVGAYATHRNMPADRLIPLPDWLDSKTAATILLQGMTAEYLLFATHEVLPGQAILLHAAAGGVGLLLAQWAAHLGATVIGTVGSDEKAKLAAVHGCAHVINYAREDFVARIATITGGKGVDVAYDSVGKTTFDGSIACLKPRGRLVSFGQASGVIPLFDLGKLAAKALHLTRPSLMAYTATREELLQRAANLFMVIKNGSVKIRPATEYKLADAAAAHRALEGRETTGKIILLT